MTSDVDIEARYRRGLMKDWLLIISMLLFLTGVEVFIFLRALIEIPLQVTFPVLIWILVLLLVYMWSGYVAVGIHLKKNMYKEKFYE